MKKYIAALLAICCLLPISSCMRNIEPSNHEESSGSNSGEPSTTVSGTQPTQIVETVSIRNPVEGYTTCDFYTIGESHALLEARRGENESLFLLYNLNDDRVIAQKPQAELCPADTLIRSVQTAKSGLAIVYMTTPQAMLSGIDRVFTLQIYDMSLNVQSTFTAPINNFKLSSGENRVYKLHTENGKQSIVSDKPEGGDEKTFMEMPERWSMMNSPFAFSHGRLLYGGTTAQGRFEMCITNGIDAAYFTAKAYSLYPGYKKALVADEIGEYGNTGTGKVTVVDYTDGTVRELTLKDKNDSLGPVISPCGRNIGTCQLGKLQDGRSVRRFRVYDAADGKVLFEKDIESSKAALDNIIGAFHVLGEKKLIVFVTPDDGLQTIAW